MPANEAADRIFDDMRRGKFYILTHKYPALKNYNKLR